MPKLIQEVRDLIRTLHYSLRTEETYANACLHLRRDQHSNSREQDYLRNVPSRRQPEGFVRLRREWHAKLYWFRNGKLQASLDQSY